MLEILTCSQLSEAPGIHLKRCIQIYPSWEDDTRSVFLVESSWFEFEFFFYVGCRTKDNGEDSSIYLEYKPKVKCKRRHPGLELRSPGSFASVFQCVRVRVNVWEWVPGYLHLVEDVRVCASVCMCVRECFCDLDMAVKRKPKKRNIINLIGAQNNAWRTNYVKTTGQQFFTFWMLSRFLQLI